MFSFNNIKTVLVRLRKLPIIYDTGSKKIWELTPSPSDIKSDAFSYPLIQYLWRICYVPDPSLGIVNIEMNKTETNTDPTEVLF